MKITLPISNLINYSNYEKVPNVEVLQFRNNFKYNNGYDKKYPKIWHDSVPILDLLAYVDNFKFEFEHYSCHLGMSIENVIVKDYYYDTQGRKIYSRDELFDKLSKKIQHIKKYCNNFSLENTNYYDYQAYKYICDPVFINKIVQQNDIGFCLDIPHAIVSSKNLNFDMDEYFSLLPLDSIREIHISKPSATLKFNLEKGEYWEFLDTHLRPDMMEYEWIDKLFSDNNLEDVYLVAEYYKCFQTLCEIYQEIGDKYETD